MVLLKAGLTVGPRSVPFWATRGRFGPYAVRFYTVGDISRYPKSSIIYLI